MIIYDYQPFSIFTTEGNNEKPLIENAKKAKEYLKDNKATDEDTDYVIIKIGNYYNVCKVMNDYMPIKICSIVLPFDKDTIYPIQTITKEIKYITYKETSEIPF